MDTEKKKSISLPKLPKVSVSPVIRWVLTLLILGVGLVVVVVLYSQQESRNGDLEKQLSEAQTRLINNSQAKGQLESELARAEVDSVRAKLPFPASDQSMDVEEAVYDAADSVGVTVASMSYGTPASDTIGATPCKVFTVTLTVNGEEEDLIRFVGLLGDWLPTATVNTVTIAEGDIGGKTLSLGISVYTM